MQLFQRQTLTITEQNEITFLWNWVYPVGLQHKNVTHFKEFVEKQKERKHYLIKAENNGILAWLFVFTRNKERWFSILVSPESQGKQLGRILLDKTKQEETVLNGWVIDSNYYKKSDGTYYKSPIDFYRKNHFKLLKSQRLELPNLSCVQIRWCK